MIRLSVPARAEDSERNPSKRLSWEREPRPSCTELDYKEFVHKKLVSIVVQFLEVL